MRFEMQENEPLELSDKAAWLVLPIPPTVNHYYGVRGRGGKFIKWAGQMFRASVMLAVTNGGYIWRFNEDDRLKVWVVINFPTKRKSDIDNRLKPLLDALEAARLFPNDSQIDKLVIHRGPVRKGGQCAVYVDVIEGGGK